MAAPWEIIIQYTPNYLTVMGLDKVYARELKSSNNCEDYELSDAHSNCINVKL